MGLAKMMDRSKTLLIFILCMNNGAIEVKCDIIEELLISVKSLQLDLKTVLNKVENVENTFNADIKYIKDNIKVLDEKVETVKNTQKEDLKNIKDNIKVLDEKVENLKTVQEEVKSIQKENLKNNNDNYRVLNEKVESLQTVLEEVISIQEETLKNNTDDSKVLDREVDREVLGIQKLYSDNEFSYYKVPVSNGTKLVEGTVQFTCEKVGLKAICFGTEGCENTDTEKCIVSSMQASKHSCLSAMFPLAKILCGVDSLSQCSQFEGVFNYIRNWWGSEGGVVDGSYWATGKHYTSGEMRKGRKRIYYAFCGERK